MLRIRQTKHLLRELFHDKRSRLRRAGLAAIL